MFSQEYSLFLTTSIFYDAVLLQLTVRGTVRHALFESDEHVHKCREYASLERFGAVPIDGQPKTVSNTRKSLFGLPLLELGLVIEHTGAESLRYYVLNMHRISASLLSNLQSSRDILCSCLFLVICIMNWQERSGQDRGLRFCLDLSQLHKSTSSKIYNTWKKRLHSIGFIGCMVTILFNLENKTGSSTMPLCHLLGHNILLLGLIDRPSTRS